jgi:cytosine deaminase
MALGFFDPPNSQRFALRRMRSPSCLVPAGFGDARNGEFVEIDILIDRGRISALAPAGTFESDQGPDLDHSIVLPGLIDCHAHLDKAHIWPRAPNPTGDVPGAIAATTADRTARWKAVDVRRRMEFGLQTAFAKGVVAIRTHLDSQEPQAAISFPVFKEMRASWSGKIDLQVSSNTPIDMFLTEGGRGLANIVADAGGNLGCSSRSTAFPNEPIPPQFDEAMARLFELASERHIDVDLHVDESSDPAARTLVRIARIARGQGFKGNILCGHCCSLALQTEDFIDETLTACKEAGIDVVSLPMVNMYLQARNPGVTPRWRGTTVFHEMRARGLRVAVAGDNVRDPFYAYGDHDMLETFTQAVRILHLDHPIDDWIVAATKTPAEIMGLSGRGKLEVGFPADLILLKARDYSEMLSRFQFDRVVLRNGRSIDTRPPDYRLLDDPVHSAATSNQQNR